MTLKDASKQEGSADFFLLLGSTGGTSLSIEDAKYVSGSEGLKSLSEELRSAKFVQGIPDETQVKIARRGKVSCKDGECTLLLSQVEDVRSVD